jgi:hypothetical protein
MSVAKGSAATCDLNKILCQENILLGDAALAGASSTEIKVLGNQIQDLNADIGSLYRAAVHGNVVQEATYSGDILNDLTHLGADAAVDGVCAYDVAQITGCITIGIGCLTGIYV